MARVKIDDSTWHVNQDKVIIIELDAESRPYITVINKEDIKIKRKKPS